MYQQLFHFDKNSNPPRKEDNYKLLYTQNIASKYIKKKLLQIQ